MKHPLRGAGSGVLAAPPGHLFTGTYTIFYHLLIDKLIDRILQEIKALHKELYAHTKRV